MDLLNLWEAVHEEAEKVPTFRRSLYQNLDRILTNMPGAIEELKATLHKMPDYNEAYYYRQVKEAAQIVATHVNCPCWKTGKFSRVEGCSLHPWDL